MAEASHPGASIGHMRVSNTGHRFSRGLIVGKFAPLHRGHEFLIDQAASDCDRLLILSYCNPEFRCCGVDRRRQWLEQRFPEHEAIVFDQHWLRNECDRRNLAVRPIPPNDSSDHAQQEFLAWLLVELLQQRPDAFYSSETYGPTCAATLTRAFGRTVHAVAVDPERQVVPVSASQIREMPFAFRHRMSPIVAATFTTRVALVGGESSGKTSLAAALAAHYKTAWVPEYGRELWESNSGILTEADLLKIAREQIRREMDMASTADKYLFCDTSPLTTAGYANWMFGRVDPELAKLSAHEYEAIVLCRPDFPFVQDGTRRDGTFRLQQHAWYREQLEALDCPGLEVAGPVPERVSAVSQWLSQF